MEWIKKLKKSNSSQEQLPPEKIAPDESVVCLDTFRCHWTQINDIINATSPRPAFIHSHQKNEATIENITYDDVEAVRNLLEHMIYLLIEEQCSDQLMGPILDYTITHDVFEKLSDWCGSSKKFKEQIMRILLKIYEVLISQAQHSLLHHKQLVFPMLKILSFSPEPASEELDGHIVLLLNLLCVWMNRDPTLLEVFFNVSANHGPAKFLIFSLLIDYIHREGSVGQQARDALLLCMAMSAENETVAKYIVEVSNFCPVLATGLSALYSTLPREMEVRADDWHCLQRNDWMQVADLNNFMNSFEFCNSVVEVAHSMVSDQLLQFFYNGFLVSVFGPSLHKTSADEVVVTTAYLNLFLRSVTAPTLMKCFLQFLLTHRHDNSLIINTLIQRIASSNRLALVSLSLIRTLIDLNCEDLMLQLVFRYLIPCQHILASQRRAIRDVDIYNASASRFLALTPAPCCSEAVNKEEEILQPLQPIQSKQEPVVSPPSSSPPVENDENHSASDDVSTPEQAIEMSSSRPRTITSPTTMAEFGPDLTSQLQLNTSYMDYLEDAKDNIGQCSEACSGWSSAYDGRDPIDIASVAPSSKKSEAGDVSEPDIENNIKDTEPNIKESVKTEINGSIPTDATPLDSLHTSSDTAMKALSVTYQTLNLTALALNERHKSSSFSDTQDPNSDSTPVKDDQTSKEKEENNTEEIAYQNNNNLLTNGTRVKEKDTTSETTAPNKLSESEKLEDNSLTESESEKTSVIETSTTQDSDTERRPRSGTSTTNSSVDEFFRSLMDIVPLSTKDKLKANKEAKRDSVVKPEEDFESGIEMSSDGDNQAKEQKNQTQVDDKDGEQDEDSMSQLSLNTDEMTDDPPGKDRNAADGADSRTYSYADDNESEFDDASSLASSSFYEPNDEYGPTDISVSPAVPLKIQGVPYTGPLIGNLFAKLDQMISNSLYENLLLTGIVARLAAYPQPLLRSFLLNTHMVFHPSVKSLYQVLNSARNKIDTYATEVIDFKILVRRAQKYLLARGTYPFSGDARTRNSIQDRPMPVPKVKTRTLGGMFKRKKAKEANKKKSSIIPSLDTLLERRTRGLENVDGGEIEARESGSMFYVKQRMQQREKEERKLRELRTKNAVYASIVLAEFLKELAAISQEHAVAGFAKEIYF